MYNLCVLMNVVGNNNDVNESISLTSVVPPGSGEARGRGEVAEAPSRRPRPPPFSHWTRSRDLGRMLVVEYLNAVSCRD